MQMSRTWWTEQSRRIRKISQRTFTLPPLHLEVLRRFGGMEAKRVQKANVITIVILYLEDTRTCCKAQIKLCGLAVICDTTAVFSAQRMQMTMMDPISQTNPQLLVGT